MLYAAGRRSRVGAVREVAGRKINEVQLGDERAADRIVWYAYVVGEREMRRGVAAQFSYALGTLPGAPAASVYAISAPCVPDCAAARQVLDRFPAACHSRHEGERCMRSALG